MPDSTIPDLTPPPSPTDVLDNLRAAREDSSLATSIEVKRWLKILSVLLPAALLSAAAGNRTMQAAVKEITPLLPKTSV